MTLLERRLRLLITGVSGLVGSNVARAAADTGHDVSGTYGSHPVTMPGVRTCQLDITDTSAVQALVGQLKPDVVIHVAAMAKPEACARQPERCRQANVDGSRLVARAAAEAGAKLVHLSSDLVYGIQRGELHEDDAVPRPIGVYATSKLESENAVLEETAGLAFVARTSLVYGCGTGATVCFFEEWLADLRQGRPIRVFTDQFRCPTYIADLSGVLLRVAELGLSGIYNVAGPRLCSRHEFALWLALEFDLDEALVQPIRMADFEYSDPRPLHLHLMNTKVQTATGYRPLEPEEGLRRLHRAMR
jgi:dTDP-4-dehydrorhamnose reductase